MTDTSTSPGPGSFPGPDSAPGPGRPPGGEPPSPGPGTALDDLAARVRASGYVRDTDARWFGGVCSGLAARFEVDPLLIRAAAIALTIAAGIGIPVYLTLWLVLPDRQGRILLERALRHGEPWPVILGVVTTLVVLASMASVVLGGDAGLGSIWVLVPVALVVWFLATRSSQGTLPPSATTTPSPPPPPLGEGLAMSAPTITSTAPLGPPPPLPPTPPLPAAPPPTPRRRRPSGHVGLMALGLAVALFGLGIALEGPLGLGGDPPVLALALALGGVSVLVLALGLSGRASGFSGFLVVLLALATVLTAAVSAIPVRDGVGDQRWVPTPGSLPAEFSLGAGDATLDLAELATGTPAAVGSGPQEVAAHLGAGQLTIRVPEGMAVRVESSAEFGELRHERTDEGFGSETVFSQSGPDLARDVTIGADPDVVVTATVDLGVVVITEEN